MTPLPRLRMLPAVERRGGSGNGEGWDPALSRGHWAGLSARGAGRSQVRVGAAGLCGASLCSPTEVVSALVVTPELAVAPGSYKAPAAELLRGRSITPPLPAVAMAKGRVAERSQTGPLQTTPPGDRAAGTQGPTAPGSRDHLKGE